MHQSKEPADIRECRKDCPDSLALVCQTMMKKDPEQRYQTCAQIKTVLLGLLEDGSLQIPSSYDANSNTSTGSPTSGPQEDAAEVGEFNFVPSKSPSKSDNLNNQSGKSPSSKNNAEAKASKKISYRRRKAPPKWVLPLMIFLMLAILLGVVAFAFNMIKQPPTPIEDTRSTPISRPTYVIDGEFFAQSIIVSDFFRG